MDLEYVKSYVNDELVLLLLLLAFNFWLWIDKKRQ